MEFKGFNRILVNKEGEGWPTQRALDSGIDPEIGFLRGDGWSLGSPKNLESSAYQLWEGEWTHFIKKGDTHWRPISEYFNA